MGRTILRQGESFPTLSELLGSSVEVYVLNLPLGQDGLITTPRYSVFAGGCIRAACSAPLAETLSALTVKIPGEELPQYARKLLFIVGVLSLCVTVFCLVAKA